MAIQNQFTSRLFKSLTGVASAAFVAAALVSVAAPSVARADIMIEPFVGYHAGTVKVNSDETISGVGYGARLGYEFLLLYGALDYEADQGTLSTSGGDASLNGQNIWLDLGVRLPLVRAWVGYGVQNNFGATISGVTSTLKGTGYKAGVAFTGIPLICINLEYRMVTFNTYNAGTGSGDQSLSAAGISNGTYSGAFVSVSLPISF